MVNFPFFLQIEAKSQDLEDENSIVDTPSISYKKKKLSRMGILIVEF